MTVGVAKGSKAPKSAVIKARVHQREYHTHHSFNVAKTHSCLSGCRMTSVLMTPDKREARSKLTQKRGVAVGNQTSA